MEISPIITEGLITRSIDTRTPSATLKLEPPVAPAVESTNTTSTQSTSPESPVSKPEEQKSTKEAEESQTNRLRAMIQREKHLLRRDRELKERERAIEARAAQYKPWEEASELAKTDKLEAMRRIGISYDDATKQLLNNGQIPPEVIAEQRAAATVEDRLKAFEERLNKQAAEQQQKQYEQTLRQIDIEVQRTVNSSDKFPLVKESEAYHDITKLIESEFHRTGNILSVEDAVERWENEIADGVAALAKYDKVRSRLQPQEPVREESKPTLEPIPKVQTLTNKTTQATPSPKPLTASERRQRAIDAFYGRLTT